MFEPSTQIWLYNNIPFDLEYKNVVDFSTGNRQAYFNDRLANYYQNTLYIEKNGSVSIPLNVGELKNVNYVRYNNNNGEGDIYAFVINKKFVNQGSTRLELKTDIWQTNLNNYVLKDSFVVREHSVTDEIGENTVTEPIQPQKYVNITTEEIKNYSSKTKDEMISKFVICWVLSAPIPVLGDLMGLSFLGGLPNICYYYVTSLNSERIEKMTGLINSSGLGDNVLSCVLIPIDYLTLGQTEDSDILFIIGNKSSDTYTTQRVENNLAGYTPKNKKLFTYPYNYCLLSNNLTETELRYEDFLSNGENMVFENYFAISEQPSFTCIPKNYRGEQLNYENCIAYNGFPQVAWKYDAYKNYLALNANSIIYSAFSSATNLFASASQGAQGFASQSMGIAGKMAGMADKAMQPKNARNIVPPNAQLYNGSAGVFLKKICLEYEQAKMFDDYFTKFGYATNLIKTPNTTSRPIYNYVETQDVNIYGVPYEDATEFKQIFDTGVTIWHNGNNYLNYSLENGVD